MRSDTSSHIEVLKTFNPEAAFTVNMYISDAQFYKNGVAPDATPKQNRAEETYSWRDLASVRGSKYVLTAGGRALNFDRVETRRSSHFDQTIRLEDTACTKEGNSMRT